MDTRLYQRAGHTSRQRREQVDWQQYLPADWRDSVVPPLDFSEYREYEMTASRCLGRDVDGVLCYYMHHYLVDTSCSDDDEDFYQVVAYGETVHAWLLRDERWLIYRLVQTHEDGRPGRGFYSFADKPPR